jgi:integrase
VVTTPQAHELAAFHAWCIQRYTIRTTKKYVGDIRTMCANGGLPPTAQKTRTRLGDYRLAWDVWHICAEEGLVQPLELSRPEVPPVPRGGRRVREPKRILSAFAFSPEDSAKLREALVLDNKPASIVLLVMLLTGLRVGDVLRIQAGPLREALRGGSLLTIQVKGEKLAPIALGPALEAWHRLANKCFQDPKSTVADAVCGALGSSPEAGGAAYYRCQRAMKKAGIRLELDGRVHLHRLRRTVAVELLRAGESLETVQQVLIHESRRTVETSYADEIRAEQARAAMERLNRR